jgi:nucleotide-binding universal stress UspA family protein
MYTHILIATDGSELAQKGLDHGLSLAKRLGSKVTILNVSEPMPVYAMGEFGSERPKLQPRRSALRRKPSTLS